MTSTVDPLTFFSWLRWLDQNPLPDALPPHVLHHLSEALSGRFDRVLYGSGKKNFKSTFIVLGMLYRFLATPVPPQGVDSFIIANDEQQAGDDLKLLKRIIAVNPVLKRELVVRKKEIERRDGAGLLSVLPGQDTIGMHGKSSHTNAYDECHGWRDYSVLEGMARDPSRPDMMELFASYAPMVSRSGIPLHDLIEAGKRGDDERFYFAWYSSSFTSNPDFAGDDIEPWRRANPSPIVTERYIEQQRRRLPSHKFRRLHLNEGGQPDGAFLDATTVLDSVVSGRKRLPQREGVRHRAFVDMSGGSNDSAALAVAHFDENTGRAVLDLCETQSGRPPFDPTSAVRKFASLLNEYELYSVVGDRFGGETFKVAFTEFGVTYRPSTKTKSMLYESVEPLFNAGQIELLDQPELIEEFLGLTWRGQKVDHLAGEHDDRCNAASGAIDLVFRSGRSSGIDFENVVIAGELKSASEPWELDRAQIVSPRPPSSFDAIAEGRFGGDPWDP